MVLLDSSLYSLVRFLMLVNDSSIGFFSISRGLRQGDPLSPLLFLIVMEALGRLISTRGLLLGFSMEIGIDISYLLSADDTLIFCEVDPNQLLNPWGLFLCFEFVLGLKTNLAKSELVLVGNVDNVSELAGIFGCGVAFWPLKYLGLPLVASHKTKQIWMVLLKR